MNGKIVLALVLAGAGAALLLLAGAGGVLNSRLVAYPQDEQPADSSTDEIAADGVIEGAQLEAALRPEINGILAAVHVQENQEVTAGTVLAELHHESQMHQVEKCRADVSGAVAQRELLLRGERREKRKIAEDQEKLKRHDFLVAETESTLSERLYRTQATSPEQYRKDRDRLEHARLEWQLAKDERVLVEAPARQEDLSVAEALVAAAQARLAEAEAELIKACLRAPCNGRILRIYGQAGEAVGLMSAQPVLRMADLSKRRVRAWVEELDACQVKVGQRAQVTTPSKKGHRYKGRVGFVASYMGPRVLQTDAPGELKDISTRVVLIDLETADDLPLDLHVQVRIALNPSTGGTGSPVSDGGDGTNSR
jgi:multidrug resistance efflux pump